MGKFIVYIYPWVYKKVNVYPTHSTFLKFPFDYLTQGVNNFYIPNIYFIHLIYILDLPLRKLRTFQLGLRIFIFTRIYPHGKLWKLKKRKKTNPYSNRFLEPRIPLPGGYTQIKIPAQPCDRPGASRSRVLRARTPR